MSNQISVGYESNSTDAAAKFFIIFMGCNVIAETSLVDESFFAEITREVSNVVVNSLKIC
jgi:hypothetical protein